MCVCVDGSGRSEPDDVMVIKEVAAIKGAIELGTQWGSGGSHDTVTRMAANIGNCDEQSSLYLKIKNKNSLAGFLEFQL